MAVRAKVRIINTWTAEDIACLYNPEQIKESLRASYGRHLKVDGQEAVKYEKTGRQDFAVSFFLDNRYEEQIAAPGHEKITMGEFQRFLRSLTYPIRLPNGDLTDPPQVLLIWSNLYAQTCVLTDLDFAFTRFDADLRPTVYTAECKFLEAGFQVFTSDERRNEYVLGGPS